MQAKFRVQNPHNIPVTKTVEIDGQSVLVSIDGFEVHLLTEDGMSGTLVLRYFGAQAKAAKEKFVVDSIVTAEFSVDAPVAEEAA